MANLERHGAVWTDTELDLIISVYFLMLKSELSGTPYVKAKHAKSVMGTTGRTHRSVEFKNQNISAVLEKLGMPWIPGYRPKWNYQNSIFDAIDRYLTIHQDLLWVAQAKPYSPHLTEDVFVSAPKRKDVEEKQTARLRQLISKFDPVQRDFVNRSLGRAGEEFVVEFEKNRLIECGRVDLSNLVRWTAHVDGDGAGYDILSFDPNTRSSLFIEVKTTNGSIRTPFFLTRTERQVAESNPASWLIYRVHTFAVQPRIFRISPPLDSALTLTPETWRASF